MAEKNAQELSRLIIEYLESRIFHDPPEPFVLAGRIMRDVGMLKSEFYIGIGRLIGFSVGEYVEGKKRYYYLLEMVKDYRDKKKGR